MGQIRLDKWIAAGALLTRSETKKAIKAGRVTVDGQVCKKPEQKLDQTQARVFLDGKAVAYEACIYLMMNKPAGFVSASKDRREKTVMSLLDRPYRDLFPVGRLDKDTEGLLLLTNDGPLAHELLAPGRHVDKTYYARLDGPVGEKEIAAFREGLDIGDDKLTLPARLEIGKKAEEVWITIQEGRFHQIKRMARAVGRTVIYLRRISMGPLTLDERLEPGQYRRLTREELALLGRDSGCPFPEKMS